MEAKELKGFFDQLLQEEKAEFLQLVCQEMGCMPFMEQMPKMMPEMMGQCCQVKPKE